jgi:hypothetical protein
MCQAQDVTLNATWQKDGNVFCFNLYIDSNKINEMFLCILSISSHNIQNLSLYINIL